ncbi:LacI family transcriptional regulator [Streptomyces sp. NP160]|uniref:substrate-binding domain-containing protein n=1 Tax=Streptomyces sp. NP160 TaxID=2586637 RepID=UPI00111A8C9D|nr:substrate-binding domain-containing protein [Streptomyces sp. NP160]TNM59439.1 LacI family transcriptional regulator [Streptomyces sp. NP160]
MSSASRTPVVGLVVPFDPASDNAGMLPFIDAVARGVREHDHDLLLVTSADGPEDLRRICDRGLVHAVVLMEVEEDDARLPVARSLDVPVVLIGLPGDPRGVSCVDVDFTAGGALAVAELAGCGCRSVALFGHPQALVDRGIGYIERFERGAVAEAARRGLPLQVLPPVELDRGSVDAALDVVLSQEDDDGVLPGLVLPHPEALTGVLAALRDRGLVPGVHLDVVAQCPDAVAARLSPPLTNTSQEPEDVSRRAVEAVFRRLAHPEEPPAIELVGPRLTRRSSTSSRDRL